MSGWLGIAHATAVAAEWNVVTDAAQEPDGAQSGPRVYAMSDASTPDPVARRCSAIRDRARQAGRLGKRMSMIERVFGDAEQHLGSSADPGGLPDAA